MAGADATVTSTRHILCIICFRLGYCAELQIIFGTVCHGYMFHIHFCIDFLQHSEPSNFAPRYPEARQSSIHFVLFS